MDFTKKDARGASEKPQFCHLRWPETGDLIKDEKTGEPVGVMVIGSQARSVQNSLRDDARAKLESAKGKPKAEAAQTLADLQADFVQSAARVTVGFQNVQRGDVDAVAPDDCEWFFDLNMFSSASLLAPKEGEWQGVSFAQQVLAFSANVGNYLGNG